MAPPARPRTRRRNDADAQVPPFLRFHETATTKVVSGHVVPTGKVERTCWLEDDLGDGFMVAYRLVSQGGSPVICETRVYPGKPGAFPRPGEWSGDAKDVPRWGMTARLLHKVRPDTSLRSVPDIVGNIKVQMGEGAIVGQSSILRRHGFSTSRPARRVGRPRTHDDLFFAVLARDYTRLINAGSRSPIKELAKARNVAKATVETWRNIAGKRGFLTSPPKGKPGGQLTAEAKAVLEANGEEVE